MNADLSSGFDDLLTAVVERVDQVCDRFEAEWKTERRPMIEDYLDGATGQERSALLRELLKLEVQLARCDGGAPTPRDYYATFPGDAALIDSVFHEAAHREVGDTASWPPPVPPARQRPAQVPGYPSGLVSSWSCPSWKAEGRPAFTALDPDLGHEFVVKLARRPVQLDPEGAEQLRAEGRKLAQLDHPNLVRVVASDIHEGRPYIVLEYVAGRSLKQYVNQQRPSPWAAARLVAELAAAVAYLHGREIVHQDITPRNVLIDERGQARLIDLGMARLRGAWGGDAGEGPVGGTRPYLSPEQAECADERIDPRTDVFGLGGVLYFLLTGHPLYESGSADELRRLACTARVEPPRRINPAVPRALERICLKALARLPENRYRSASEFGLALAGPSSPAEQSR